MSNLDQNYRDQIRETLGRPLTDEELVNVDGLEALTPAQLAVARTLAHRQLVLCGLYLRAVTSATIGATKRFIDELLSA